MNRKKLLILVAVAGMLFLAGCSAEDNSSEQAEELGDSTGNDISNVTAGSSFQYEVKVTEKNQMNLVQAQPPFQMEQSLERENLIRRYKYLNDADNVHHVYAYTESGQIMGYWVAQGKVSSVNSKLTNDAQIVQAPQHAEYDGVGDGDEYFTVESPQMDGSYGTNGDAIFFFTTSGKYVEFNGKYIVSEEPMNIQSQVVLEQNVNSTSG
jgi:hypothetical protein